MSDAKIYRKRITNLRSLLDKNGIDAAVILSRPNTRYLSGFVGTFSIIVITLSDALFFTDPRYESEVKRTLRNFKIRTLTMKSKDETRKILNSFKIKKIGFEDCITVSQYGQIKKFFSKVRWVNISNLLWNLREIKDESEIETIAQSARIADYVMRDIAKILKSGITEKQVELFVKRRLEEYGADDASFDSIIASGENSACPHHKPTDKKIQKGDFVTIDIGAKLNGYCSDMTRTFIMGKASIKQREIYSLVLQSQIAALEAIKPGIKTKVIDKTARDIISKQGLGEAFKHGTGHGVGLEIHEPPRLNSVDKNILQKGMAVTIEPGIYIDGFGGVRIEDLAIVTKDGVRILSQYPKKLIEII